MKHDETDYDASKFAGHHSLGWNNNQAAPGPEVYQRLNDVKKVLNTWVPSDEVAPVALGAIRVTANGFVHICVVAGNPGQFARSNAAWTFV